MTSDTVFSDWCKTLLGPLFLDCVDCCIEWDDVLLAIVKSISNLRALRCILGSIVLVLKCSDKHVNVILLGKNHICEVTKNNLKLSDIFTCVAAWASTGWDGRYDNGRCDYDSNVGTVLENYTVTISVVALIALEHIRVKWSISSGIAYSLSSSFAARLNTSLIASTLLMASTLLTAATVWSREVIVVITIVWSTILIPLRPPAWVSWALGSLSANFIECAVHYNLRRCYIARRRWNSSISAVWYVLDNYWYDWNGYLTLPYLWHTLFVFVLASLIWYDCNLLSTTTCWCCLCGIGD